MAEQKQPSEQNNDNQQDNQSGLDNQPQPPSQGQKTAVKVILIVVGALVLLGIIIAVVIGYFINQAFDEATEYATNFTQQIQESTDDNPKTTDQASVNEDTVSYPDTYPAELVPVYEPSGLKSVNRVADSAGSVVYSVSLKTTDSLESVKNFYKQAFSQDGWQTTGVSSSTMAGMQMYSVNAELVKNGETKVAVDVMLMKNSYRGENVTRISLDVTDKTVGSTNATRR